MQPNTIFRVAAAQLAPAYLDASRTLDKACSAIAEAARNGAGLIAFPEAFVPGFPYWLAVEAPIDGERLFEAYAANSINIAGPEMARIQKAAREGNIVVSLGFSESTNASVGCLWNSNVIVAQTGQILSHHRKMVPTFYEKLIWTPGDAAGLRVIDTSVGRVGVLICGENVNPLARFALMTEGEQLHISSWPAVWPSRSSRQGPGLDMGKALRARSTTHSTEAKAFSLAVASTIDASFRDRLGDLESSHLDFLEGCTRALSVIIDPSGSVVAEASQPDECLLYGEIDLCRCVAPKAIQDLVGSYNRFDIFNFTVDRRRTKPATFIEKHGGPNVPEDA